MGTHPIFESDFDCLTVQPKIQIEMLARLAVRQLGRRQLSATPRRQAIDWSTSAGPVKADMGNWKTLVVLVACATNAIGFVGMMTGTFTPHHMATMGASNSEEFNKLIPTTSENFDYKGFNPSPSCLPPSNSPICRASSLLSLEPACP